MNHVWKTKAETYWNHDSFYNPKSFLNQEYMNKARDLLIEKLLAAGTKWPPLED